MSDCERHDECMMDPMCMNYADCCMVQAELDEDTGPTIEA